MDAFACAAAYQGVVTNNTDFSVVLFRSDFMLFSEKNRMKVHNNQWVLTMPCPLERLAGATSRGHTMAPEGQKPSQWLCLTKLPRKMSSQPIVHKVLSWGAIRKSACILAEITIRKSQNSSFSHTQWDLVVDHRTSDVESNSPLDFLLRHTLWTPFGRLISCRITSIISIACDFTTKFGGMCFLSIPSPKGARSIYRCDTRSPG